ncbi:hypothetical protein [Candidatus Enterococcus courvalinii]|uniref:KOW domain-containing protein n=1 Tax=Candidatus Enterococcus courvalinii TaxID=2815329 RepID=A0ABS3HYJ3_9ENTE|nr:hypothetical protein [Enterococcus sp. MSG2901]MBO0481538.1 hypothetical protein [Enterococcus sp. MSG2901]
MNCKVEIGTVVRGIGVNTKKEVEGSVLNVYNHVIVVFPKHGSPVVVRKKDIVMLDKPTLA